MKLFNKASQTTDKNGPPSWKQSRADSPHRSIVFASLNGAHAHLQIKSTVIKTIKSTETTSHRESSVHKANKQKTYYISYRRKLLSTEFLIKV
jgi:hypothetical protein